MGSVSGIGGILGGLGGAFFGPAGSGIGKGIFGGIGAIIDRAKNKKGPEGIDPSLRIANNSAMENLNQAKGQSGLSSGQVQRAQEAGSRSDMNKTKLIDTVNQNPGMSSLAKEQMSKAVIREITKNQNAVNDRILGGDIQAQKERIASIGKANKQVLKTGAMIEQQEQVNQQRADIEQQAFQKNIVGAMTSVGAGFEFGEKFGFGKGGDLIEQAQNRTGGEKDFDFDDFSTFGVDTETRGDEFMIDDDSFDFNESDNIDANNELKNIIRTNESELPDEKFTQADRRGELDLKDELKNDAKRRALSEYFSDAEIDNLY